MPPLDCRRLWRGFYTASQAALCLLAALDPFQAPLMDFRDSGKCPDILGISLEFLLAEFRCHHEDLHTFVDRRHFEISRKAAAPDVPSSLPGARHKDERSEISLFFASFPCV